MNRIENSIRERRSVRTFQPDRPLSNRQIDIIRQAIDNASSPFGGTVNIEFATVDTMETWRPSTYGVIRGASSFFMMGYGDDTSSALSAGWTMEQVILAATSLGLGSCWIAATFSGSDFERLYNGSENTPLKIVSPVGHAAARRSLIDLTARMLARSAKRKPFEKLFFDTDFTTPLKPDSIFGHALDMMRLAPSSTNSQPWRAVVDSRGVHFYHTDGRYATLDCGIGMSHFALTAPCPGKWNKLTDTPPAPKGISYLRSYIIEP